MHTTHYRKVTRSQVWPDTEATLRVTSKPSSIAKGTVGDLGSEGMFLFTHDAVPVNAIGEVTIDLDSKSKLTNLKITAQCKAVRKTNDGVGIKFTSINLSKLQECIVCKINRMG